VADERHVLILGAGINGAALARELVLNGVPVVVVDSADLCSGASAYSSRLIHGGLRYLEYGEFDLVRESLAERNRLLRLAPQFVRPLRLFIPATNRFGGAATQVARFLGHWGGKPSPGGRGLYVVRAGLWMYAARCPAHSLARCLQRCSSAGGGAVCRGLDVRCP
jgi:glycerol-3-phosphate dehydrogenase